MCLGVPGRIVERLPVKPGGLNAGLVEFDGLRRPVCLELVPDANVGDFVLVHAGIAISRMDTDEADRLLAHLRAIGDVDVPAEAPP